MATPTILNIYPANASVGIPVGDSIEILFNQEMDTDSINEGTFVVSAPDDDVRIDGELQPFNPPLLDEQDILSSPYYDGRVPGTITFERRNISGGVIDDSTKDYDGDGSLWYTAAIFTPERQFVANKKYTVLISGDTDIDGDFDSGVKTRSVFDTKIEIGTTEGCNFCGTYTGDSSEKYYIRITSSGESGVAEYEWWKDSAPLDTFEGLTSTGRRELEDGVCVYFDKDITYTSGDKYSVVVVPYELMPANYQFYFFTGDGSILTPPSESSASGITDLSDTTSSPFRIVSITPSNGATNLELTSIEEIVIKFNKNLDPTTITQDTVQLLAEAVNGDSNIEAAGKLAKILSVSGDTLTIQIV